MAQRVPITLRLDSFEGPLDLLLYLIQTHELDISTISLTKITNQYLSYVRLMQELNFDIASEFLVMAATLLYWKSKALLPQETNPDGTEASEESEELSAEALVRQLLEHQRFLAAGEELAQLPRFGEDVFARQNDKPPIEKIWNQSWKDSLDCTGLALCYQDILIRARKRTQILKKETVSLTDKIIEFSRHLEVGKLKDLRELLSELALRPEVVVTFLASLELSRLKKMRLHQEGIYQPIYLELIESLENFELRLASGFDSPTTAPAASPVPDQPPESSVESSAQPSAGASP